MRTTALLKKAAEDKNSYAIAIEEIRGIVSLFKGTKFVIDLVKDPENSGEESILVKAIESDMSYEELDRKLSSAMLELCVRNIKKGVSIIPSVEPVDVEI